MIVELDMVRIQQHLPLRCLCDLVEQGVVFSLSGLNEKIPKNNWFPSMLFDFIRVGPPPIKSEEMSGFLEYCLLLREHYGSHLVVDKIECKGQYLNSHKIPFYGLLGDYISKPMALDMVFFRDVNNALLM